MPDTTSTRSSGATPWLLLAIVSLVVAACSGDDAAPDAVAANTTPTTNETQPVFVPRDDARPPGTPVPTTTPATTAATTSTTTTSTSTTSTTSTTTTSTTTTSTTTTTLAPGTAAPSPLDLSLEQVVLGTSVEGRPIVAERHGTVGGRRVLVIGVIHGNEDAGIMITDRLRERAGTGAIPDGIELWLVPTMNPDGQLAQDRHNANQVDLNRNFPLRWGPIGQPGDGQYAGSGPASEPETQAMVAFISQLRPDIAMWYHQDANLIIPGTGRDGRIRARYAQLTGLPVADCCDGGIYTGIAATWARDELADQGSVAFIVELPGDVSPEMADVHTDAVLTIAAEA